MARHHKYKVVIVVMMGMRNVGCKNAKYVFSGLEGY